MLIHLKKYIGTVLVPKSVSQQQSHISGHHYRYVFTGVCLCTGVVYIPVARDTPPMDRHPHCQTPPGQTHPRTDTSLTRHSPLDRHTPGQTSPWPDTLLPDGRWSLQRTVRILLEYFLVINKATVKRSPHSAADSLISKCCFK